MSSSSREPGCEDPSVHPLDNPVWHALTGPQRTVAEHHGAAARYDPEVALFAALPDDPDEAAWGDLAELVGPGGTTALFRDAVHAASGWQELMSVPLVQMVDAGVPGGGDGEAIALTSDDVPDMLALVERTNPGPFVVRTIELGTYLGVRRDGALVAMAGQRMRLDRYVEISGVCTEPELRGTGVASALVRALVTRIKDEGAVPILHAASDNTNAIRLYEHLGFERSRDGVVVVLRAPGG
jgi:ribosomal protein S18 acetylase RimI-like enzyme